MDEIAENIMPNDMPFHLPENSIYIILLLVLSLAGVWIYNRYFSNGQVKNHGENDPSNMNYCEGDKCYF
jgi:hypothetical protein